ASISQASGARMMVRIRVRPRRATVAELATDGQTTRIVVSPSSGGTRPVTACFRPSVIVPIRNSRHLNGHDLAQCRSMAIIPSTFAIILTDPAHFAKRKESADLRRRHPQQDLAVAAR